jgi:hypothetical protein
MMPLIPSLALTLERTSVSRTQSLCPALTTRPARKERLNRSREEAFPVVAAEVTGRILAGMVAMESASSRRRLHFEHLARPHKSASARVRPRPPTYFGKVFLAKDVILFAINSTPNSCEKRGQKSRIPVRTQSDPVKADQTNCCTGFYRFSSVFPEGLHVAASGRVPNV